MKTAGVVFDFYDDPTGTVLKKAFPNSEELPEQVKVAHILSPEEHDVLRDEAYALHLNNEGKILRKFACVDAGNTLLSMLYLEQAAEFLPEEAVKTAAANITAFAEQFGLGLTPFIKEATFNHPQDFCAMCGKDLKDGEKHPVGHKDVKGAFPVCGQCHAEARAKGKTKTSASGMSRTRDSMRQPVVGDEADWAQRCNLVSVRGGADSGRVIPTANQMKTAGANLTDDDMIPLHTTKGGTTWGLDRYALKGGLIGAAHGFATGTSGNRMADAISHGLVGTFAGGAYGMLHRAGRGGMTLTDDKKDNGPDKKNPVKPDTKIIDLANANATPLVKKSSAEKTACGRYPLDSYGDVQAACRYFDEHWTEMYLGERREFAVKTASRAHELGIQTSELLGRYGSSEYAPDIEAHLANRKANAPAFAESYNLLKEKRSSVSPDQFVHLLIDVDKASGLNWEWGGAVTDPYLATYGGLEKSASAEPWSWSNADGVSVSHQQLLALSPEVISKNFGEDVGVAFKNDPVGIFESMPDNSKTIMATLASNLEKTSGVGQTLKDIATAKQLREGLKLRSGAKEMLRANLEMEKKIGVKDGFGSRMAKDWARLLKKRGNIDIAKGALKTTALYAAPTAAVGVGAHALAKKHKKDE